MAKNLFDYQSVENEPEISIRHWSIKIFEKKERSISEIAPSSRLDFPMEISAPSRIAHYIHCSFQIVRFFEKHPK